MSNKRSDDSWHYSGVKKRDFRHDKSGPEEIFPRRKKNQKWCKSKVEKEHDFKPYKHHYFLGKYNIIFKCISCGKERYKTYESWPKEIPVPGLWNGHWKSR